MCKLLAPVLLHKPLAKQYYWLLTKENGSDKSKNSLWKALKRSQPSASESRAPLICTLAAVSSLFEVEKSALSHNWFYILALSSVNILCSVSSNAGSCRSTRGAFPVSLHAQRSDGFCILCMRLAHLAVCYALALPCWQIMCLQH